ncbi:MAG: hypothetical protein L0Z62_18675 [Gemmataceae bacterium]|nr:hypothetical protein [Gemmataceae bacterium]
MNIFEASSCVGVVAGSAGGCYLSHSWFGLVGAVLGLPAGAVVGWFVLPLLVFAVFVVGIFFEEGPAGLRELFRRGRGSVRRGGGQPLDGDSA